MQKKWVELMGEEVMGEDADSKLREGERCKHASKVEEKKRVNNNQQNVHACMGLTRLKQH